MPVALNVFARFFSRSLQPARKVQAALALHEVVAPWVESGAEAPAEAVLEEGTVLSQGGGPLAVVAAEGPHPTTVPELAKDTDHLVLLLPATVEVRTILANSSSYRRRLGRHSFKNPQQHVLDAFKTNLEHIDQVTMTTLTCTAEGDPHLPLATLTDPLLTNAEAMNPHTEIVTAATATVDHCPR